MDYNEDKTKCLVCHEQDHPFKPADHLTGWNKDHGPTAQLNKEACIHCHQNSYCTDCHEGDNLDRLTHPLNYKNNHGIDAARIRITVLPAIRKALSVLSVISVKWSCREINAYAN